MADKPIVFVRKRSEQCLLSSTSENMSLDSRYCNCDQVENLVWNNDLEADKYDLWFTENISVLNFTETNSVLNLTEGTSVLNLNHRNLQVQKMIRCQTLRIIIRNEEKTIA